MRGWKKKKIYIYNDKVIVSKDDDKVYMWFVEIVFPMIPLSVTVFGEEVTLRRLTNGLKRM